VVLAVLLLYFLLAFLRQQELRRGRPSRLKRYGLANLVVALAFLPWVPALLRQYRLFSAYQETGDARLAYKPVASSLMAFAGTCKTLLLELFVGGGTGITLLTVLGVSLFLLVFLFGFRQAWRSGIRERGALVLYLIIPCLLLPALRRHTDNILNVVQPGFLLFAGFGMEGLLYRPVRVLSSPWIRRGLGLAFVVVLSLCTYFPLRLRYSTSTYADYREIAEYAQQSGIGSGSKLVALVPHEIVMIRWYTKGAFPETGYYVIGPLFDGESRPLIPGLSDSGHVISSKLAPVQWLQGRMELGKRTIEELGALGSDGGVWVLWREAAGSFAVPQGGRSEGWNPGGDFQGWIEQHSVERHRFTAASFPVVLYRLRQETQSSAEPGGHATASKAPSGQQQ
jgi:hypothetical protein